MISSGLLANKHVSVSICSICHPPALRLDAHLQAAAMRMPTYNQQKVKYSIAVQDMHSDTAWCRGGWAAVIQATAVIEGATWVIREAAAVV